ncbi:MAG: hypothetical protein AAFO70_09230 [Pseudomonadota bacterium]
MDIVKTASEWARTEMFASAFFVLFGMTFLAASYGVSQFGRTDATRGYVWPMLVAGALLLVLGVGLVISNQGRLTTFPTDFATNANDAIAAEIARAEQTLAGYRTAVFRVMPALIALCAILIPFLTGPIWRAGLVVAIAMLTVIIVVDSGAIARLEAYRDQLVVAARG